MEGPLDRPLDEILEMIRTTLEANPNAKCFLKWTCPKCKQRVTATAANTHCTAGYKHDENGCDAVYTGTQFGLMVMFPTTDEGHKILEDILRHHSKEKV